MRGKDFFAYNLADVQNLRSLARLLQLECRPLAVAEGRFDDATICLPRWLSNRGTGAAFRRRDDRVPVGQCRHFRLDEL